MPLTPMYDDLKDDLLERRRAGRPPRQVRLHPRQRQMMEAEFRVEHREGRMYLEGVLLVADEAIAFERYELDF